MKKKRCFAELEKLQKSYAKKYGDEPVSVETAMNERTALGDESGMFESQIDDSPAMKRVKSLVRGEIGKLVKEKYPEAWKNSRNGPIDGCKESLKNSASLTRGKNMMPMGRMHFFWLF